MMKTLHGRLTSGIALLALPLLLAACGDKPQTPAPQTAPPQSQTPAPQLFQQDRQALDKAKGVGQTEANSAEAAKKEAENQTK